MNQRDSTLAVQATTTSGDRTVSTPPRRKHTDLGNAERMADRLEGKILWVAGMGWLAWDGKRWRHDKANRVLKEAGITARSIYEEAAYFNDQAGRATDDSERDKWAKLAAASNKWAMQSEAAQRMSAMTKLAAAQPRLVLEEGPNGEDPTEMLDADPMALNCRNGILNLETLELRPHDPSELHTRVTGAGYDPDAKAPFFRETIARALPDENVRRWVQTAFGSVLSGEFSERLFLPHGITRTMKSTTLAAARMALGDYAKDAPSDLLVSKKEWNASSEAALASLHGRRLVTCTETEQGKRLNEVLAKKITGEPLITAKFMRQDYFTFKNQMTVFLATNHKPVVQGADTAIWRRVKLIPFMNQVEEPMLPEKVYAKFEGEIDGILAWLVEGWVRYRDNEGLGDSPADVQEATDRYREEMDPLEAWIDESFEADPDYPLPIDFVRQSYQAHCEKTGRHALGATRFNELMELRGYTRPKSPVPFDDVPDGSGGTTRKRMKAWKGLRPKGA